jgi:hypothetical protein
MSAAGLSVLVFGIYVVLNGAGFTLIPNTLLGLLGVPTTNEPWIRILGWVMVALGYYYIQTGRHDIRPFFMWTVYARVSVLIMFVIFCLLGWAPTTILIFGAVDLLGAVWTFLALRAKAKGQAASS